MDGGIGIIDILYKSNILALVGGGKNPKFTPNKVILWDDYQTKIMNEFKFVSLVRNVKLKKDRIIIVCEQRIYVYQWTGYKLLEVIETYNNPNGVIGVNSSPNFTVLAYPVDSAGLLQVKHYENSTEISINAQDKELSFLAINKQGNLIACAGVDGKLIRIFYLINGMFIEEFRRGVGESTINFMIFDNESDFLSVSCDNKFIHIYSLGSVWTKIKNEHDHNVEDEKLQLPSNTQRALRWMPDFLTRGYFGPNKSIAQIKVTHEKSICAFSPDNTFIIITAEGGYFVARFDRKTSGKCKIIRYENLMQKKKI